MASPNSFIENFIAGSIASLISIIGDTLTVLVLIGCFRIPSMKSSFGILTVNQCLAELIPCTACLIVFFFGLTLNLKMVIDYSYVIGGTTMVMLYIIIFSYFIISFNRFCAIAFPFAYSTIFKEKFVIGILFMGWLIPFSAVMYLLVFQNCTYMFNLNGWYFYELKNDICGSQLNMFITAQFTPVAAIVIVDIITLILLTALRKRIFKTKSAEARRREMNFAKQVLVQGFVFLMRGFWYRGGRNIMPDMPDNWKIFITTSFSTSVFHVFDPAIVFICNIEFRTWLLGEKKKTSITAVGQLSTSVN